MHGAKGELMNFYSTILLKQLDNVMTVTINRLQNRNSINSTLITDLTEALDEIVKMPQIKLVILEGKGEFFCTGMDFEEITFNVQNGQANDQFPMLYMKLIRELAQFPKIIISKINGQVMAGGVGIVAVSDLVISTPRSEFSLSEALLFLT